MRSSSGQVVEASLGYFINPIVNVLLGVLVLQERLNKAQWASVALAAAGVLWLTLLNGRLPWIALALAVSFGLLRPDAQDRVTGRAGGAGAGDAAAGAGGAAGLAWWSFSGRGAMARGDLALDAGWCRRAADGAALAACLRPAHAACRWPPWACCSTCRPPSSWRWACGCSTSPSTARACSASASSGPAWRCIRRTAGGARARQPRRRLRPLACGSGGRRPTAPPSRRRRRR